MVGAAGLCGRYVLEAALRTPFRVRAVVHGPAGRERVAALGVDDVVEAGLETPDTVRQALKDADFVFMIPPAFHPEEDCSPSGHLRRLSTRAPAGSCTCPSSTRTPPGCATTCARRTPKPPCGPRR
ncbi:NAD(P)H-binding protein [Streptomyces sp. NPDC020597]|uniref:NAD(P)H-binding protein n=1 Tax=unclassified Streptomyces TaxID=2593676 RepID=UPI0037BD08FA